MAKSFQGESKLTGVGSGGISGLGPDRASRGKAIKGIVESRSALGVPLAAFVNS